MSFGPLCRLQHSKHLRPDSAAGSFQQRLLRLVASGGSFMDQKGGAATTNTKTLRCHGRSSATCALPRGQVQPVQAGGGGIVGTVRIRPPGIAEARHTRSGGIWDAAGRR